MTDRNCYPKMDVGDGESTEDDWFDFLIDWDDMENLDLDWGSSNDDRIMKDRFSPSNDQPDHIYGRNAIENNNELAAKTNKKKTEPVSRSSNEMHILILSLKT